MPMRCQFAPKRSGVSMQPGSMSVSGEGRGCSFAKEQPLPSPETLMLPGCMETPLRFGANWHLMGILCRPQRDRFHGFAVLICNSGGNPRHGFARFGVECARALAQAGITSLR